MIWYVVADALTHLGSRDQRDLRLRSEDIYEFLSHELVLDFIL